MIRSITIDISMENNCYICTRISQIKKAENPYFIKELKTGYVVLEDFQFYKGYTLFLSKSHVEELHQLRAVRTIFLEEMAVVAEAVFNVFKPVKLNYELLGNTDRHLHWHIIPRYKNDPSPNTPIWVLDKSLRRKETLRPSNDELKILVSRLNNELSSLNQL